MDPQTGESRWCVPHNQTGEFCELSSLLTAGKVKLWFVKWIMTKFYLHNELRNMCSD